MPFKRRAPRPQNCITRPIASLVASKRQPDSLGARLPKRRTLAEQRISPRWLAFLDFPARSTYDGSKLVVGHVDGPLPSFSGSPAYFGAISPANSICV